MDTRDGHADTSQTRQWARPVSVYLGVLAALTIGAVIVFYIVLPMLIPGPAAD